MPDIFIDACKTAQDANLAAARRDQEGHENIVIVEDVFEINRYIVDSNGGRLSPPRSYLPSADDTVKTPAIFVVSTR